jgi:hypothetical protein
VGAHPGAPGWAPSPAWAPGAPAGAPLLAGSAAAASATAAASAAAAAAAAAADAGKAFESTLRKQLEEAKAEGKRAAEEAVDLRGQLASANAQLAEALGAVTNFSLALDKTLALNEELRGDAQKCESRAERAEAAAVAAAAAGAGGVERKQFQELEDAVKCRICLDEPRCMLTLPCKHLVSCAKCYLQMADRAKAKPEQKWAECSYCRGEIYSVIKVEGGSNYRGDGIRGGGTGEQINTT